ncbi:MAG: glutathione synthase, partial [Vulcanococcus sp.]
MSRIDQRREAQLFVIDPIAQLRPTKDSSVALMQAAQRAGQQVWVCTPAQLAVRSSDPAHEPMVLAQPIWLA